MKRFVVLFRTLGTYNSLLLVSWLPVLVRIDSLLYTPHFIIKSNVNTPIIHPDVVFDG